MNWPNFFRSPDRPAPEIFFSFWLERYRTDELQQQDLSGPDPFRRAGALFSAAQRGLVPRNRMQEIALNGTWPEKFALHYLFTVPDASSRQEHLCWLQPQENIVAAGEMVPLSASHQEHIEQLRQMVGNGQARNASDDRNALAAS